MKTTGEVIRIIQGAIDAKQPFSMVRIGDGESRLLNWPEITPDRDMALPLGRWFGVNRLEPALLESHKEQLSEVCQGADLVGIPDKHARQQNIYWELVEPALSHIHATRISMNAHIDLEKQGWSFLRGLSWVGIINCHDVGALLIQKHDVREVHRHPILGEFTEKEGTYAELYQQIAPPFPGAVYLIGAGLLGKFACQWIKERGGIGIDVGSIFDLWAGVASRSYIEDWQ